MTFSDHLPPFDIEAEESIVAALMVDADAVLAVAGLVAVTDFFREKNAYIYEACMDLHGRDEVINQITVAHELARRERLVEVGGQSYLSDLIRQLPTSLGVEFYARIVQRDSAYRQLIHVASGIMQMAYEAPAEIDDVMQRAADMLESVRGGTVHDELRSLHDILGRDGYRDRFERHMLEIKAITGIATGWPKLDMILDGFGRQTLTTIAGESSSGKSLWIQNAILHQVINGVGIICFSTEMSGENVLRRLIFMNTGIDPVAVRRHQDEYTTTQFRGLTDTLDQARDWPVFIYDAAHLTTAKIRSTVRRARRKHAEIDDWLVIVDLIDRVRGHLASRAEDLTVAIQDLQGFAREQDIPVILTSHVNRAGSASSGNRFERLSDSGAKSKDADNVLFLVPVAHGEVGWRELTPDDYRVQVSTHGYCFFNLICEKNRFGQQGAVLMKMDWNQGGRFREAQAYER